MQIFEQIISGDLSPFIDDLEDPHKYNNAKYEKRKQYFHCTVTSFKKSKDKFTLLDKKVISLLHPLAEKIVNPQQNLFKPADVQDIAPDSFKLLKLNKNNIVSIS